MNIETIQIRPGLWKAEINSLTVGIGPTEAEAVGQAVLMGIDGVELKRDNPSFPIDIAREPDMLRISCRRGGCIQVYRHEAGC